MFCFVFFHLNELSATYELLDDIHDLAFKRHLYPPPCLVGDRQVEKPTWKYLFCKRCFYSDLFNIPFLFTDTDTASAIISAPYNLTLTICHCFMDGIHCLTRCCIRRLLLCFEILDFADRGCRSPRPVTPLVSRFARFVPQVHPRSRRRGSGPALGAGSGPGSHLQRPLRRAVPRTQRPAQ